MSESSDDRQGAGGLRAWWQRLWQVPDIEAPAGSSSAATSAARTELAVQVQAQQQPERQVALGRITKEDLLRLRPVGPAGEAPPDLLAQRASFWAAATHDLCQPAQALALF
jgi:hypothetical protein